MASTLVSTFPLAEQRRPDMDDIDGWVPPHGKAKSLDVVHLDEGYSSSINSLPGLSKTRSLPGDDSQDKDSVRDLDVGPVSDDLGDVDWTQYDPPDALFVVEDVESEIVSEIVGSSIENIRRQVRMMHDAVREVEEFESKGKQKAENVDLLAGHEPETQQPPSEWQNEPSLPTPDAQAAQEPRRWSGGFARRLLRHVQGSDKGESSAMGAVLGLVDRQSLERPASRGDTPQTTAGEASSSKPSFFAKLKKDKVVATVECVSCFEDVPVKASVKTVCHSYCKECFARLVEAALDNEAQWPVKCCLNNVPARTITKNVPRDLLRRYAAKAGEFATPVGDRLYCPAADCGQFVPRYSRSGSAAATPAAQCPAGHRICLLCRGEAHAAAAACPGDADTRLANDLAAEEGWRRCPRCGVLVEHGEACQHMTCRCGGEFCYVCGAAWRSCACSMEDLRELKRRVAARRVERESLASEEERGLREALALIEQLERDEEARAAEYRAELDRLAAESRRLERKERRLRERARRIDVAKKYRGERAALDALAARQALLLRRGHADETARLAAQQAAEAQQRAESQAAEQAARRAATEQAVRACEAAWDADFRARARAERKLEAGFVEQLAAAVRADRGPSAAAADAALRAYMRRNDARLAAYEGWRAAEVESVRQLAAEDLAVRDEVAALEAARAAETAAGLVREHRRRQVAERKWAELVLEERVRLLDEMETVERENGGEPLSDDDDDGTDIGIAQ